MKINESCTSCANCKNSIFRSPGNPLHAMGDSLQSRKSLMFDKGEYLFRSGEKANGLYCIYSGEVKITKPILPDQDATVYKASDGEMIGLNSVKDGRCIYSAMATERTQVCFMKLSEVNFFIKELSGIAQKFHDNKY